MSHVGSTHKKISKDLATRQENPQQVIRLILKAGLILIPGEKMERKIRDSISKEWLEEEKHSICQENKLLMLRKKTLLKEKRTRPGRAKNGPSTG